jgi:hypothetical protein
MSGGNVPKGNQIVSHPIDLATGEGAAGIALDQKKPTAEPDDKPLNYSQNNGVSTLTNPVNRSPQRQTGANKQNKTSVTRISFPRPLIQPLADAP